MVKQIDKFFIVLGAICLAVFNALIPNLFLKKTEDFIANEQTVSRIEEYNEPFKKPEDIPDNLDALVSIITNPLFTVTTFQYKKNLYQSDSDTEKTFMKKVCEKIPECEVFVHYAPYATVTVTTAKPSETTVQIKEPKCGKPALEINDIMPGKVIIKVTPGALENAQLKGFEVFRNDIKDEKGEKKVYLFLQQSELERIDDKVEPDKEYTYQVKQVCIPTEGKQEVTSELSDEKTAKVKRKYYITCYNTATQVSIKIKITQYEDDGTEKVGVSFVQKNKEIEAFATGGGKISTGLTLQNIVTKKVSLNNKVVFQRTIEYCKVSSATDECEEGTREKLDCVPEEFPKKPQEDKKDEGKDKSSDKQQGDGGKPEEGKPEEGKPEGGKPEGGK